MKFNRILNPQKLLFLTAAQVWVVGTPAVHAQALTDLNSVSVLPTGTYPFSAGGETFNAYVHNDGTYSWLLVGRGRDGWEFDTDGQGLTADVGVASVNPCPSVPNSQPARPRPTKSQL